MTTLILVKPQVVLVTGAAMMAKALHLYSESRPQTADVKSRHKLALLFMTALAMPTLTHARAVDLRTTTESGNAIIM